MATTRVSDTVVQPSTSRVFSHSSLGVVNSKPELQKRVQTGKLTWLRPLFMLLSRVVLFGIFALRGSAQPWQASIGWWPITATLTNLLCLVLLDQFMRLEGLRLRDLYTFDRHSMWRDILTALGIALLSSLLVLLPSSWLTILLFGNANATFAMMFKPLPPWATWTALVLFPLSIALTELPTYFAYVMPRIEVLSGRVWLAVLLPVLLLSAQHITLPLIFNWHFMVWRLLMFLGLALLMGMSLHWWPRLLPYLMLLHLLGDLQAAWMVFSLSR
jgi:hypothetical protein